MRDQREWSQDDNERQGQPLSEHRQDGGNGDASDTNLHGCNERNGKHEINPSEGRLNALGDINESNGNGYATDTNGIGRWQNERITNRKSNVNDKNSSARTWQNFPTVSPIHYGDDGISDRLDSITFPKWRNESIKAGGNAIVPQVVLQIFKTIEQYENLQNL
jgi:DNA (cytosine-5)-methyltransferase 1